MRPGLEAAYFFLVAFFFVAFFFVAFFAFLAIWHLTMRETQNDSAERRRNHTLVNVASSNFTATRLLTPGSSIVIPYSTSDDCIVRLWCVITTNCV